MDLAVIHFVFYVEAGFKSTYIPQNCFGVGFELIFYIGSNIGDIIQFNGIAINVDQFLAIKKRFVDQRKHPIVRYKFQVIHWGKVFLDSM
jgi:hypothetical protein